MRDAAPGAQSSDVQAFMTSVATVVGCSFLVPQLARLIRFRDPSGVSTAAAAMGVVQTGSWIVYGLGTGAWAVVVTSSLATPQYVCVVLMSATSAAARWRAVVLISFAGTTVAAVTIASARWGPGAWTGLGLVVTIAVVWQYLPAVASAFGTDGTAGLSISTWLLIGTNGVVWTAYGVITHAGAITAYGLVLVIATAAVLAAIAQDRSAAGRGLHASASRPPDVTGCDKLDAASSGSGTSHPHTGGPRGNQPGARGTGELLDASDESPPTHAGVRSGRRYRHVVVVDDVGEHDHDRSRPEGLARLPTTATHLTRRQTRVGGPPSSHESRSIRWLRGSRSARRSAR